MRDEARGSDDARKRERGPWSVVRGQRSVVRGQLKRRQTEEEIPRSQENEHPSATFASCATDAVAFVGFQGGSVGLRGWIGRQSRPGRLITCYACVTYRYRSRIGAASSGASPDALGQSPNSSGASPDALRTSTDLSGTSTRASWTSTSALRTSTRVPGSSTVLSRRSTSMLGIRGRRGLPRMIRGPLRRAGRPLPLRRRG